MYLRQGMAAPCASFGHLPVVPTHPRSSERGTLCLHQCASRQHQRAQRIVRHWALGRRRFAQLDRVKPLRGAVQASRGITQPGLPELTPGPERHHGHRVELDLRLASRATLGTRGQIHRVCPIECPPSPICHRLPGRDHARCRARGQHLNRSARSPTIIHPTRKHSSHHPTLALATRHSQRHTSEVRRREHRQRCSNTPHKHRPGFRQVARSHRPASPPRIESAVAPAASHLFHPQAHARTRARFDTRPDTHLTGFCSIGFAARSGQDNLTVPAPQDQNPKIVGTCLDIGRRSSTTHARALTHDQSP